MNSRAWLKDYRRHYNYTQSEMADLLGIAVTTYASYEQGYRTPKVSSAQRYAKKMKIDWNYFFMKNVRISYDEKEVKA